MTVEYITDKTLTDNEKCPLLCRKETFWIFKLNTLSPNGFIKELEIVVEIGLYTMCNPYLISI